MSGLKISGLALAGCLVLMSLAHGLLGWPVVALGLGFLTFGIGACLLLDVGGHFVGFAVFGLLFLAWAFAARQASRTPAEERP